MEKKLTIIMVIVLSSLLFIGCPNEVKTNPLVAPNNITITPEDGQLKISWSLVKEATEYEVYYHTKDSTNEAIKLNQKIIETNVTIVDLENNTTYYVWVKAKNQSQVSAFSISKKGIPKKIIKKPSKPTINRIISGDSYLTIYWSKVEEATSYEIYYNTTNIVEEAIKISNVSGTSKLINGLKNDQKYYVWMKAKNESGVSDFSSPKEGIPKESLIPPETPKNITVVAGDSELTVSWDLVNKATSYLVYYNTTDLIKEDQKIDNITDKSIIINKLTNDTTYYIWVRAISDSGSSNLSAVVTGTPIKILVKPEAPTIQTIAEDISSLTVTWQAVSGATSYEVYYNRENSTHNAIKVLQTISNTNVTITELTENFTYYVWIKAKNDIGVSDFSIAASLFIKKSYNISIKNTLNGTITIQGNISKAKTGTTITFTTSPATNYRVSEKSIKETITKISTNTYNFVMQESDIIIDVEFEREPSPDSWFTYTDNGQGITITKYTGTSDYVVIPYTINGKPVTIIGNSSFNYPANNIVKTVHISNNVTSINYYAFASCSKLETITIPDSVTFIGDYAFYNSNINEVIFQRQSPPVIKINSFDKNRQIIFQVPLNGLSLYKEALKDQTNNTNLIIGY